MGRRGKRLLATTGTVILTVVKQGAVPGPKNVLYMYGHSTFRVVPGFGARQSGTRTHGIISSAPPTFIVLSCESIRGIVYVQTGFSPCPWIHCTPSLLLYSSGQQKWSSIAS
jgi:hypothetical protein